MTTRTRQTCQKTGCQKMSDCAIRFTSEHYDNADAKVVRRYVCIEHLDQAKQEMEEHDHWIVKGVEDL